MKRHIPNTLTLLNLLTGCVGIVFVFEGNILYASYAIWLAALFDFFDGFAARTLNVSSPIGKELDSLADLVTFGVLPAFMMMSFVTNQPVDIIRFIPLIMAAFAALRLAKFNIDDSQTDSFTGMPTPSIAFFVSGLPFWLSENKELFSWPIVIITSIALSVLMVIPVKMIALKFKSFSFKENWYRYFLLLSGLVLLLAMGPKSFPITISLYFILSLFIGRKEAIN